MRMRDEVAACWRIAGKLKLRNWEARREVLPGNGIAAVVGANPMGQAQSIGWSATKLAPEWKWVSTTTDWETMPWQCVECAARRQHAGTLSARANAISAPKTLRSKVAMIARPKKRLRIEASIIGTDYRL